MDQEQTEQTEQLTSSGDVSRDDLIAAVREAGGTETVDVAAEEAAAVEQPAAAAEQPPAEEEPRIAAILRAREKAHEERESIRSRADEMLERARQESERILQEARDRAAREFQEDLERRRRDFHSDPTGAIRALGDPQDVIDRTLHANTPEGRRLQQLESQLSETAKRAQVADEAKSEIAELRKQVHEYATQEQVRRVKAEFTGSYATQEKAPYAYAELGGADGVFSAGNRKAAEWQQKGLRLGVDFDFADVASYVEREAKESFERKLKTLNLTPAQQVSAGAPATGPGNAPKVPANGTRTLSAAQGSERRTSPKPLSEMTAEEQRKALMEEVAAARRSNPDSVF